MNTIRSLICRREAPGNRSVSPAWNTLALIATTAAMGLAPAPGAAQEAVAPAPQKPAAVFQISTLPALSLGLYDGGITFGDLLKHGDFGLGTFAALDGELIILNGTAWRVRADRKVSAVDRREITPFAAVTHFVPDITLRLPAAAVPAEYAALQQRISAMLPTPNAPYAVAIQGTFARLKLRSVPGQNRPYPPLADVVKTQTVWELKDIRGTLVGFRFPAYLSGVNLSDYHFHFISDDRQHGGHLLDGALQEGEIRVQTLRGLEMQLPTDAAFDRADLATDQSAALKASEKAGTH
jgi:acetolactate decarboxylase